VLYIAANSAKERQEWIDVCVLNGAFPREDYDLNLFVDKTTIPQLKEGTEKTTNSQHRSVPV